MNPQSVSPQGKRTLVEPLKAAGQSSSGLIWSTNQANIAPVSGLVVKESPTSYYRVGDKILFRRFSVDELKFVTPTGENVLNLVEDQDVVAIEGKLSLWSRFVRFTRKFKI